MSGLAGALLLSEVAIFSIYSNTFLKDFSAKMMDT